VEGIHGLKAGLKPVEGFKTWKEVQEETWKWTDERCLHGLHNIK
jgi:hypothetical protein